MIFGRIAIAMCLAAVLSVYGALPASAAAEAGQVLTLAGDCTAIAEGLRTVLKMGDAVHVGDKIEVADGAKIKLRMIDGSILSLASGAKMTIQNYDADQNGDRRDAKLSLDSGLMRAVVSKASQPARFEVDTATSVAAARSTDWFVEALPEATMVSVLDGEVEVEPRQAAAGQPMPAPAAAATPPAAAAVAGRQPGVRPGAARPAAPAAAPPRGVMVTAYSATMVGGSRMPMRMQSWTQNEFDQLIDRTRIAFGWCQCTQELALIKASCEPSPASCETTCAGSRSSFIPNARAACARYYVDTPAVRQPRR